VIVFAHNIILPLIMTEAAAARINMQILYIRIYNIDICFYYDSPPAYLYGIGFNIAVGCHLRAFVYKRHHICFDILSSDLQSLAFEMIFNNGLYRSYIIY